MDIFFMHTKNNSIKYKFGTRAEILNLVFNQFGKVFYLSCRDLPNAEIVAYINKKIGTDFYIKGGE